jgi:hypothetical protein
MIILNFYETAFFAFTIYLFLLLWVGCINTFSPNRLILTYWKKLDIQVIQKTPFLFHSSVNLAITC